MEAFDIETQSASRELVTYLISDLRRRKSFTFDDK
jgi:hypothetical protein